MLTLKTETMTMTRKNNKLLHPPLTMNNTIINQVTEHKHLGLEISKIVMSLFNLIALIMRHLECALSMPLVVFCL
jgi:hypothetical protein